MARRLSELGLVLGCLGGLIMAYGALIMVRAARSGYHRSAETARREKIAYLLGSLAISLGFAVAFIGFVSRTPTPAASPSASVSATP